MSFAFEGTAPKLPQKPLPWIGAIFVACLGILQQFCLIGNYSYKSYVDGKLSNYCLLFSGPQKWFTNSSGNGSKLPNRVEFYNAGNQN